MTRRRPPFGGLRRVLGRTDLVGWLVALAAAGFVLWQLEPGLIFRNSTPTGGDLGSHVWGPWYMREHLLPQGQITGWSDDWWAGFAAYRFYFPLPALAIALLSFVLPYGLAFKLVVVSGVVSLPVSAYVFGRLAGLRRPGPALLSAGALLFLFDTSYSIYGGNLASTLSGEYSFSIALSLALLFLGVVARGLDSGRHRVLATVLLLATGLTHLLPTLFAAAAALVLLALRFSRRRLWWLVTVGGVAILLVSFWALPFLARLDLTNDLGWVKLTDYPAILFPEHLRWVLIPATLGLIAAVGLRVRTALSIAAIGLIAAVGVVLMPEARLWNARFLPFWYLAVYLLAAVGVAELLRAVVSAFTAEDRPPPRTGLALAPVLALGVVFAFLGGQTGSFQQLIPGAEEDTSYLPAWARWGFSGYEAKDAWPEYQALMQTMEELPCGRAMWEHNADLNSAYGTPMALMLLPYWTDGCIDSMEGLFFESSATVPYHFVTQFELSRNPSAPQRDLPYEGPDVTAGTDHMRTLGVDYYLARTPEMIEQADDTDGLRLITTSGPWHIYGVEDSQLVEGLDRTPVVVEPLRGEAQWRETTVDHFARDPSSELLLATDGPAGWPRIHPTGIDQATSDPVDRTPVTGVSLDDEGAISFRVAEPGIPVVVRTSYFPNWKATGADGPWRVSPNAMVVVPTDTEVRLTYGTTPVEVIALLLSVAGLALLGSVLRRPLRVDEATNEAEAADGTETLLRRLGVPAGVATAVDLVLVVVLVGAGDVPIVAGNVLAIGAAATVALLLRRSLPGEDPQRTVLTRPSRYLPVTLVAAVFDTVVLLTAIQVVQDTDAPGVLAAKTLAIVTGGAVRLLLYRELVQREVRAGSRQPPPRKPAPGTVRLSVVVPAYREADRIGDTVARIRADLDTLHAAGDLEVVVVDDGSPDETAAAARAAGADQVVVLPANRGKGAAVRAGFAVARGRTIAFLDADLAYAPEQLARFVVQVEQGHDVVMGSRLHVATTTLVRAGRLREVAGRVFNVVTWFALLGGYRDTQTGIKAFRSDAARLLADHARVDGFAFDVELLHLAERYHLSIAEVPVDIANTERSTVNVGREALRMARDIVRVRWWASAGAYDETPMPLGSTEGEDHRATADEAGESSGSLAATDRMARSLRRLGDRAVGVMDRGARWVPPTPVLFGVAVVVLGAWLTVGALGPHLIPGDDARAVLDAETFGLHHILARGHLDGWYPEFLVGSPRYRFYGPGTTIVLGITRLLTFGLLSTAGAMKVVAVVCLVLVAPATAFLARSLGWSRPGAAASGILALGISTVFGFGLQGAFGTTLLSATVAAPLAIFALGALARLLRAGGHRWTIAAALTSAAVAVTHPMTLAIHVLLSALLVLALVATRATRRGWVSRLLGATAAGAGLSAPWTLPYLQALDERGPVTGWAVPSLPEQVGSILGGDLAVSTLLAVVIVLGLVHAVRRATDGSHRVAVPAVVALTFLVGVHAVHRWWPSDLSLHLPNRGLGFVLVLLVLPAGAALASATRRMRGWTGLVAIALAVTVITVGPPPRAVATDTQDPTPALTAAAEELGRRVPEGGRFVLERDFPAEGDRLGIVHPDFWLAEQSGEWTLNTFAIESSRSPGVDRYGHVLDEVPPDQLATDLRRYAVTHVVVQTPEVTSALSGTDAFTRVWDQGPLAIFAVGPDTSESVPYVVGNGVAGALASTTTDRFVIDLDVNTTTSAAVAVSWSSRWHGTVDGQQVELREAADGLVQLTIPAGAETLELHYATGADVLWGLVIGAITLAGLVASVWRRRKGEPQTGTDDAVTPPRTGA